MFCPKCGNSLPDTAKFCDACGSSIKKKEDSFHLEIEDTNNENTVDVSKDVLSSTELKKSGKPKIGVKILAVMLLIIVTTLVVCLADGCLIHEWRDATCTEPVTCIHCGAIDGEPLGHQWIKATCEKAKTCVVCAVTEGSPAGHSWSAATCTEPQMCSTCYTVGEPAKNHQLDSGGYCTRCNQQIGIALTMSNYKEYIKAFLDKTENYAGVTYYELQFTPVKNVQFYDVKIKVEIIYDVETTNYYRSLNGKTGVLLQNGQYRHKLSTSNTETIQINNQGYGTYGDYTAVQDGNGNRMEATFPNVSANIKKITGYVVEQ